MLLRSLNPRLAGILIVVAALSCNSWAAGAWLSDDGRIDRATSRQLLLACQLVGVLMGLWVAIRPPRILSRRYVRHGLLASVAAMALGGLLANVGALRRELATHEATRPWNAMVESEELILQLSAELVHLDESAMAIALPSGQARSLFADEVQVVDVSAPDGAETVGPVATVERHWLCEEQSRTLPIQQLQLWRNPLADVDYFEHAHFWVIEGHFTDDSHTEFETSVGFSGLARLASRHVADVQASLLITWTRPAVGVRPDPAAWTITKWRTTELRTIRTTALLFEQVQDKAIQDSAVANRLRVSAFEERWREFLSSDKVFTDPIENPAKVGELLAGTSPGLSVVDLNRDGHDDLLIANADASAFLLNRGDGTFEDVTNKLGIDPQGATAILLADFDNDGDTDAFLGRDLARSSYYVNDNGHFVDRTEARIDGQLPNLVSSLAAADYDGDGLLDLYVSTYAFVPLSIEHTYPQERKAPDLLLGSYLSEADARHVFHLAEAPDFNATMNAPGPPNVLLRNTGDGFEVVSLSRSLRVYRNSFQATWSDFDHDGDPDLYIANDYAPNNMLRNDGNGKLTDVTLETGTADVGLGMGVTWGDYDGDGQRDLYVSNMYSKAGKRIINQFRTVDAGLYGLHRGNSLFRNQGGHFENVSGERPPAIMVEKAGWSWGAQFVDINNDGWLDIYAPSGWITAPKGSDIPVDI